MKPALFQFLKLHNCLLFQFLCCKNICEFLKACKNTFEMKPEDLFDPWDLYRLDDFGKVLRTLSKLSMCPIAKLSGIRSVFQLFIIIKVQRNYGLFVIFLK